MTRYMVTMHKMWQWSWTRYPRQIRLIRSTQWSLPLGRGLLRFIKWLWWGKVEALNASVTWPIMKLFWKKPINKRITDSTMMRRSLSRFSLGSVWLLFLFWWELSPWLSSLVSSKRRRRLMHLLSKTNARSLRTLSFNLMAIRTCKEPSHFWRDSQSTGICSQQAEGEGKGKEHQRTNRVLIK